ncbi:MAG: hypothetical protein ACK55I_11785, partial [bacterium]
PKPRLINSISMSEVLHSGPVEPDELNHINEIAGYNTTIVLIFFDPVEQQMTSLRHENLRYQNRINAYRPSEKT